MRIIKLKSSTRRIGNPKNWTQLQSQWVQDLTQFFKTHILEYLCNFDINYIICKNFKNFKFKLFQRTSFFEKKWVMFWNIHNINMKPSKLIHYSTCICWSYHWTSIVVQFCMYGGHGTHVMVSLWNWALFFLLFACSYRPLIPPPLSMFFWANFNIFHLEKYDFGIKDFCGKKALIC